MTDRLMHFSSKPLSMETLDDRPVTTASTRHYFKPVGLWVSVEGNGDGWRDWCHDESFGLDRLALAYDVELIENANILRVSRVEEIDAITTEFKAPPLPGLDFSYGLDWPKMSEKYDGLIITPYLYERRFDEIAMWYYSWDCASGCIWRKRAIASIEPAKLPLPDLRREAAE